MSLFIKDIICFNMVDMTDKYQELYYIEDVSLILNCIIILMFIVGNLILIYLFYYSIIDSASIIGPFSYS